MEVTMFSAWLYDHIRAQGGEVKVAHSMMLQAIAAGRRKSDQVDARKISDLLRCDYFPEYHMATPEIQDRRRVLRFRNLLLRQAVRMKNKVSGLLMVTGIEYSRGKLHQKKYFLSSCRTEGANARVTSGVAAVEPDDDRNAHANGPAVVASPGAIGY